MKLNVDAWKEFEVNKILTIINGKGITKEEIEDNKGNFIVVQSGESNNGVLGKIDLEYCKSKRYSYSERPCLTVARSGSAGFVSFQIHGCVVGDSAKILLLNKDNPTTENYVFIQAVLTANRFKYAYGRKVTEEKYMNDTIKLPIQHNPDGTPYIDHDCTYSEEGYIPDWQFMEDYIKSLHHKPLTTKNTVGNALALKVDEWEEFRVDDLFSVQLSKGDIKLDDMLIGDVPLVSSGETNNGVVGYIDSAGDGKAEIFSKNKITVDMFGNVYYQEDDFYAVSHGRVNILEPVFDMTKYIGLFIASIINKEKFKYSYGRAVYSNVLCNVIIKLPIQHNADGTPYIDPDCTYSEEGYVPDWKFMEDYIKSLPYGDRI